MTVKMFLLAVLGSNIFWIVVALFSLIGTALVMKKLTPVTYVWLTEGEHEARRFARDNSESFDKPMSTFLVCIMMFAWWIIVLVILIVKFCEYAWLLLGMIFRAVFSCIDKIIPNVSIKIEKK